jgi:hypothetical protein
MDQRGNQDPLCAQHRIFGKNKFRVGTVEDAICWKYGMHSWDIVQTLTKQPRSPN